MLQDQVILDMKNCPQTETQSVYQHGLSVKDYTFDLIEDQSKFLWKLPDWFAQYKNQIVKSLYPKDMIAEYTTFHDCGKPYCLSIDLEGKRHFPNHCQVSYDTWLSLGGDEKIAKLILNDMKMHTIKAVEVDEFITYPEAITLLIVSLAEVHSNAAMFGGIDSVSFKIKWNQINKRGKAICQKLFGEIL